MESIIYEGQEVFVRGNIISTSQFSDTCMVVIESEDTRAVLEIKKSDIKLEEDTLRKIS